MLCYVLSVCLSVCMYVCTYVCMYVITYIQGYCGILVDFVHDTRLPRDCHSWFIKCMKDLEEK